MHIIVCVKQVPDTNEVRIDPVKGTLIRDGVPSILNPDDANALEGALALKDSIEGTKVSVVSMGPPQATAMLRECLAMGADVAYLLSSRVFGGADTYATSTTLAAGIKKIEEVSGKADLVFAGRQAIDGDTAQVGPQVAMRLNFPVVSYVQSIRELKPSSVIVERQLEDGFEVVEVQSPCVLTMVKELNQPRYMTVKGIVNAYSQEIVIWDDVAVEVSPDKCGLKASPTQVFRSFTPPPKDPGEILQGGPGEVVSLLINRLRKSHAL
ncbi:electron transfer flavoprotein beta subunit [Alkalispirochaeta americana]|uniref:Protein FixA n=1 Tax=Alkalispirochaeta americana TaxID=159291 RepID=A0A1N6SYA1_9SPIO|nr:electron transfer flavoprotein subunit beta [Alkalispirochaeta americana]SIQ46099.1 electron transfer flavoprotein beta subunit [Alkalispirochaeta americana]